MAGPERYFTLGAELEGSVDDHRDNIEQLLIPFYEYRSLTTTQPSTLSIDLTDHDSRFLGLISMHKFGETVSFNAYLQQPDGLEEITRYLEEREADVHMLEYKEGPHLYRGDLAIERFTAPPS